MLMDIENLKVVKLIDSLYQNEISQSDDKAIYCEIQYQRDRSSFAGMAFKFTHEANVLTTTKYKEKIVERVSKYENKYIGCERDYIACINEKFSSEINEYGIEILFLVYSDVRSSQIVFEKLIEKIQKNIESMKELV